MINYRTGKERYISNELGSLYLNKDRVNEGRPIIYIGGQMEHRCHVLEQTGFTTDLGHNMFTGNWFYDYPIFSKNKDIINGQNFANNLKQSLEDANLYDVDLITHSFGGIIGSLASDSDRIHKVYAIHPPITGTPLANPKSMEKYKPLFNKHEVLLLSVLKYVVNSEYGFEKDNYSGLDLRKINLDKLLVIGSGINPNTEKGLLLDLYNMVKKVTGFENDGVVVFDKHLFDKLGINYVIEDEYNNHFISKSEKVLNNAYQLIKKLK